MASHHYEHHHHHQEEETTSSSNNSLQMRQLLIRCAHFISQSDFLSAHRLLSILSSNSSPYGDATERLLHYFTTSLSHRIPSSNSSSVLPLPSLSSIDDEQHKLTQSCYLSLNQITPFIRFTHLTANQAILEAIVEGGIHVVDFDIMHGVQWPPLMQALAERFPSPMLRISAIGRDLNFLHKTGDRLSKFAHSLGLRFQFHPLLLLNDHDHHRLIPASLTLFPDEALAFNCVLYLHKLVKEDLQVLLHKIKALNPKVVTIAEKEANFNHPLFMQRFLEALNHYSLIFDSLEATLPPNSRERLAVEQVWFGREIDDVVSREGNKRKQRYERYESWETMLKSLGFSNIPLSPFALSQAKLLLRLHYPSEGYHLQILHDSLFLGWQNRPLFSVSSWH
ncbi:scarecrow-like protein 18 [Cucurbita maxima]|uniref:Scarecrow-like protein 18 n=1 Tax=Cucurbita maxima TaxID=3661 RepID=A0A6J1KWG3_CUCMA|nr:scarecrow-like protein 18 [Cucurbita maxima]